MDQLPDEIKQESESSRSLTEKTVAGFRLNIKDGDGHVLQTVSVGEFHRNWQDQGRIIELGLRPRLARIISMADE
jgi:hypothetical protein